MPRLVSFSGLIQNFRRASPPLSYESSTLGTGASLLSPHIRESGFQNREIFCWGGGDHLESENILLVESRILGFGIQNTAQEIRKPLKHWNPESKLPWQGLAWNPVPRMGHPRHGIQNPRLSWIPSHGVTSLGPSANGNEQWRIQGRGPEGRAPLFLLFFFETAPPLIRRSGSATNESNTKNPDFAQLKT